MAKKDNDLQEEEEEEKEEEEKEEYFISNSGRFRYVT
jgi:hypothetical protein